MLGISRWQLLKALAAIVGIVGTVSLALLYFIPSPPSTVTMATGNKGGVFEYYGRQYREIFARFNIELKLRETSGAAENVKLLQDPESGVQIAPVLGAGKELRTSADIVRYPGSYFDPRGEKIWREVMELLAQYHNRRESNDAAANA